MYLVGIDVGGMSIKGGVVTTKGEIIFKTAIPTTEKYTADKACAYARTQGDENNVVISLARAEYVFAGRDYF